MFPPGTYQVLRIGRGRGGGVGAARVRGWGGPQDGQRVTLSYR